MKLGYHEESVEDDFLRILAQREVLQVWLTVFNLPVLRHRFRSLLYLFVIDLSTASLLAARSQLAHPETLQRPNSQTPTERDLLPSGCSSLHAVSARHGSSVPHWTVPRRNKRFLRFYSGHVFCTFLPFFVTFSTFFILKNAVKCKEWICKNPMKNNLRGCLSNDFYYLVRYVAHAANYLTYLLKYTDLDKYLRCVVTILLTAYRNLPTPHRIVPSPTPYDILSSHSTFRYRWTEWQTDRQTDDRA